MLFQTFFSLKIRLRRVGGMEEYNLLLHSCMHSLLKGLYFVTSENFVKSSHGKKCYVICVCVYYTITYIHNSRSICFQIVYFVEGVSPSHRI